jgi:hypothetical protein
VGGEDKVRGVKSSSYTLTPTLSQRERESLIVSPSRERELSDRVYNRG